MGDVALKIEYKNTHPPIFLSTKLINPTEPSSFNPMRRLASFLCLCLLVVLPVFPANTVEAAQNSASVTVGGSFGSGGFKPSGSAGIGSDEGHASSTTEAGISGIAGKEDVRTGDTETGLQNNFDKDKVQKEIDAQIAITQSFGQQASKAVGDYAHKQMDQAMQLREQAAIAKQMGQTDRADELTRQAQDIENNWGETGVLRLAAHTVIGGLTGGASGAAGSLLGTLTASQAAKMLQESGITQKSDPVLYNALVALASTAAGALVGGTPGAGSALNEVTNNTLVLTGSAANKKKVLDLLNTAGQSGFTYLLDDKDRVIIDGYHYDDSQNPPVLVADANNPNMPNPIGVADTKVLAALQDAQTVVFRLVNSTPDIIVDSFANGLVDVDALDKGNNQVSTQLLLHFMTERFAQANYEMKVETLAKIEGQIGAEAKLAYLIALFNPAHEIGGNTEIDYLKDIFPGINIHPPVDFPEKQVTEPSGIISQTFIKDYGGVKVSIKLEVKAGRVIRVLEMKYVK